MSDFAGTEYEFAAGSLFGLRGWNMDEQGRLHGVTHREVWRPGVNVSVCKAEFATSPCPGPRRRTVQVPKIEKRSWFSRAEGMSLEPTSLYGMEDVYEPCTHRRCDGYMHHDERSNHTFDPKCSCGFWAYDEAGFKAQGTVIGVIEAFGKTTIGTKGFRAEKARIVALCRENGDGKRHSYSVQARLATLYPEVEFHDTRDDLITAHPAVLRQWGDVDEDFWTKPVARPASDPFLQSLQSAHLSLQSSLARMNRGMWSA